MGPAKHPSQKWRNGKFGPVALITGASDGIGAQFARELAALKHDLILVARSQDRLDALASDLTGRFRIKATVIAADLSQPSGCETVLEQTKDADIGLFVAAAGFGSSGLFLAQDPGAELNMIDLNCRSVVAMTHAIGKRMVARGGGGIVLMSSLLAFQGVPRAATYAATKAFVQSFAEGLCTELKPMKVDVIATAPGPIASGFSARAKMTMGMSQTPKAVARSTLNALGRQTTVRPGWLSQVLELSLALLPRSGRIAIMTRVMNGMADRGTPERPESM
jgi:uncharacterized protein